MTASKSLFVLRKVDAVSLGSPLKFKVDFKIQRFSKLSSRFMKQNGSTEKYLADNWKFIKRKKSKNVFIMKVSAIDLWHFFTSVKHVSLTVISSIKYIYVHIKYIKTKSNTQNCQVENNMKMIFTIEKFKSVVVMLSKLHDHGKATSTSTRNFPLSKTIKIN